MPTRQVQWTLVAPPYRLLALTQLNERSRWHLSTFLRGSTPHHNISSLQRASLPGYGPKFNLSRLRAWPHFFFLGRGRVPPKKIYMHKLIASEGFGSMTKCGTFSRSEGVQVVGGGRGLKASLVLPCCAVDPRKRKNSFIVYVYRCGWHWEATPRYAHVEYLYRRLLRWRRRSVLSCSPYQYI